MTNFEILFDNGGGALLLTRKFCHSYCDGKQLAQDVLALIAGASTSDWDGNQPEFRRVVDPSDTATTRSEILAKLRNPRPFYCAGHTERTFWLALGLPVDQS